MESKKDIKKMFPHLFKELEGSENKVKINSIRKDPQEAEAEVATANENYPDVVAEPECESEAEAADTEIELEIPQQKTNKTPTPPDKFRNYNPTIVDFLRRCDNSEQAEEIIAYLCKKGELTENQARQLRAQIKKDGIRSFGPKKQTDYYFKETGLC